MTVNTETQSLQSALRPALLKDTHYDHIILPSQSWQDNSLGTHLDAVSRVVQVPIVALNDDHARGVPGKFSTPS